MLNSGVHVIARHWHGVVPAEKAEEYEQYVLRTGIADLKATQGNCGAWVLHSIDGADAHFLVISLWDSLDHIRAFAGDDIERARYYPEDEEFLLQLEPKVTHYVAATTA